MYRVFWEKQVKVDEREGKGQVKGGSAWGAGRQ